MVEFRDTTVNKKNNFYMDEPNQTPPKMTDVNRNREYFQSKLEKGKLFLDNNKELGAMIKIPNQKDVKLLKIFKKFTKEFKEIGLYRKYLFNTWALVVKRDYGFVNEYSEVRVCIGIEKGPEFSIVSTLAYDLNQVALGLCALKFINQTAKLMRTVKFTTLKKNQLKRMKNMMTNIKVRFFIIKKESFAKLRKILASDFIQNKILDKNSAKALSLKNIRHIYNKFFKAQFFKFSKCQKKANFCKKPLEKLAELCQKVLKSVFHRILQIEFKDEVTKIFKKELTHNSILLLNDVITNWKLFSKSTKIEKKRKNLERSLRLFMFFCKVGVKEVKICFDRMVNLKKLVVVRIVENSYRKVEKELVKTLQLWNGAVLLKKEQEKLKQSTERSMALALVNGLIKTHEGKNAYLAWTQIRNSKKIKKVNRRFGNPKKTDLHLFDLCVFCMLLVCMLLIFFISLRLYISS